MGDEEIPLNLEPEDLEEPEATPPPAARPGDSGLLVIDHEDLKSVPPLPKPAPLPHPGLPAPGQYGFKSSVGRSQTLNWGLLQMILAGALGGFLAWMVNEPFVNDAAAHDLPAFQELSMMALFGGLLGGMIGAALGGVEGLSSRVSGKFLRGAGLGLLIGFVGGAIGGLCGQVLFSAASGGQEANGEGFLRQVAVRGLAWAVVGVGVGLAQGAGTWTPRKLTNGILGGTLGGLVGGLLFDPIGMTVQTLAVATHPGAFFAVTPHLGWVSRLLAMVVLGACTGAAIGLVEELRKEAWIIVVQGPLAGKQFILYRPLTVIGSSPKADICLLKDPAIHPQHAVLQETPGGHLLLASPEAPVQVDGHLATHRRLVDGDRIALGRTVLEYHERALRAWVASPAPAEGG
jgi:hypothetical protein